MPMRPQSHESRMFGQRNAARHKNYSMNIAPARGLGEVRALRSTNRWRNFSRWFLDKNPLCDDPYGDHRRDGVTVVSVHTHHRVPLATDITKAFEEDNCQALCAMCHTRIEVDTANKISVASV